jgi:hypothetical protein
MYTDYIAESYYLNIQNDGEETSRPSLRGHMNALAVTLLPLGFVASVSSLTQPQTPANEGDDQ